MAKTIKLILFLTIFFSFLPLEHTFADQEEGLTVKTVVGFENKRKPNHGYPLTITVSNSGRDITGELVVNTTPSYNSGGNILTAIDLPSGSEKTFTISVPGSVNTYYHNQPSLQQIRFFEGSWQNGKEVTLQGDTKISSRTFREDELVVGLLSDDPDSLGYLKSIKTIAGQPTNVVSIEETNLPSDFIGLGLLDIVIIDQFSFSELPIPQQEAFYDWVHQGGIILVAGDNWVNKKMGIFKDSLPMPSNIKTVPQKADFFEDFGKSAFPKEVIDLTIGDLHSETTIIHNTDDGVPLLVSRKVGKGEILQLSFSLTGSTLANWDEAPNSLSSLLQKPLRGHYPNYYSFYEQLNYTLSYVTGLFASSFLPYSALVILFTVYIILVFPTLYFLLRRFDKREFMWWVLPCMSFVICLSIFLIGGKDRIVEPQLNESVLLQIDESGVGSGYGSFSFLSNRRGNYTVGFRDVGFYPIPISDHYNNTNFDRDSIRYVGDDIEIDAKNVEYWSIRTYSGPIINMDIGTFTSDLRFDGAQIEGTITNHTQFVFDDLLFLSGANEESLGAIGPGETISVSISIKGALLRRPSQTYHYNSNPRPKDLTELKKQELLSATHDLGLFPNAPVIVGFTSQELLDGSLNNKTKNTEALNLIIYEVDVKKELAGEITLTGQDLNPYIENIEGYGYYDSDFMYGGNSIYADKGRFIIVYHVPEDLSEEAIVYKDLQVKVRQYADVLFEIYDSKTEEFIELQATNNLEPKKFIDENNQIIIQITKEDYPYDLYAPELSLKGEMKQ